MQKGKMTPGFKDRRLELLATAKNTVKEIKTLQVTQWHLALWIDCCMFFTGTDWPERDNN